MKFQQAIPDILLLRHPQKEDGTLDLSRFAMPVAQICRLLSLKPWQYYYQLTKYRQSTKLRSAVRLTSSTKKKVCSMTKLRTQATMSLKQRVNDFNATNPNAKLSLGTFRQIYREGGVRYKRIVTKTRFRRTQNQATKAADESIFKLLKSQITQAIDNEWEVIMIDESTFSQQTYNRSSWARTSENIETSVWWDHEPPLCVLGAVSQKRGLIHYSMNERTQTSSTFLKFMKELIQKVNLRQTIFLLDNWSVHKTPECLNYFKAKKIEVAWNKPYSPQYNGIEMFWALSKKIFRRKVTAIKTGTTTEKCKLAAVVRQSLLEVAQDSIIKCCLKALKLISLN